MQLSVAYARVPYLAFGRRTPPPAVWICTRPAELGLATVASDTDLSATDATWSCQTIDQLTEEARVFFWAAKLFKFILP